MTEVTPRTAYLAKLRQGLRQAGVDIQWLYQEGRIDRNTMSRLLGLLSSPIFSHPEELSLRGYPEPAVRSAEKIAARQVQESISGIVDIFTEAQQCAARTTAREEAEDNDEGLEQ